MVALIVPDVGVMRSAAAPVAPNTLPTTSL